MQILSYLPGFLVLLCQWIGILAMRGRKNGAWWLMLIGVSIVTLGAVLSVSFALLATGGSGSFAGGWMNTGITIMIWVSVVGSLLFGVGFALYGLMSRSALERQEQLESMAAAMGDELQSLRNAQL